MGNILENTVECTCEEFVAEIAGKRRKPYLDALKSTFRTIVLGKSTLVKEMSSFLRENEGRLERKRVQELMSGWLNACDFAALLNPCLLARSAADVTDEATLAVDFSDIGKEFGGDGMEGMEMGCDGSRHCTAMGYDFISVSLVGAAYREAFPVYAKLGMGRHCHADLIYGAIRAVMEGTGGLGWLVFDRGMDDARFLRTMKRDGRRGARGRPVREGAPEDLPRRPARRGALPRRPRPVLRGSSLQGRGGGGHRRPRGRVEVRRQVPLRRLPGRGPRGPQGDVRLGGPSRAGLLRPLADRDLVPDGEAGVRA